MDWFNQVDATYRRELREQHDLNWGRVEARVSQAEGRFDARMTEFEARLNARLDSELAVLRSDLHVGLERLRSDLLKWMFLYWTGTALTVIGLVSALRR